jgi:hypothetical protein
MYLFQRADNIEVGRLVSGSLVGERSHGQSHAHRHRIMGGVASAIGRPDLAVTKWRNMLGQKL